jgi:hypothetical protein
MCIESKRVSCFHSQETCVKLSDRRRLLCAINAGGGLFVALACAGEARGQPEGIEAIARRWSNDGKAIPACRPLDPTKRVDGVSEECVFRAIAVSGQTDTVVMRRQDAGHPVQAERAIRGVRLQQLLTILDSTSRDFERRGYAPFACVTSVPEVDAQQQILEWRSRDIRVVGVSYRGADFWTLRVLATTEVQQVAPYTCRPRRVGQPA